MRIHFIAVLIGTLLHTSQSETQEPRARIPAREQLTAAFDSLVPAQMQSLHIPGAVLVIVKDGNVYLSRGWGVTNVDTRTPVTPDRSVFRTGSISKVFTATAALQQVEHHTLRLGQDVNEVLVGIKVPTNYPQAVHLEHLLTHTAGFDEINVGRKVFDPAQVQPLEPFLRDRLVRRREPGTLSSYGTYGITLAGLLVERASGMRLRDYFVQHIFQPLGMHTASFGPAPRSPDVDVVTGYDYTGGKYRDEPWEYFHTSPASDVNLTAADMAKFMIAHLEGERASSALMSSESLRAMHTTHFQNDPRIPGMAYGLFEERFHGYRALYHGGTMAGFKASMWLWPDQGMGLFLAYNREIDDLERRVLNRFAARVLVPQLDSLDTEGTPWRRARGHDVSRLAGEYRPAQWCHSCQGERGSIPPSFTMKTLDDSTLTFWGGQWAEVEPNLLRLMNGQMDFGQIYVAVRTDSAGRVLGLATGGPWWNERIGAAAIDAPSIAVSSRTMARYTGRYSLPPFGIVTVGMDDLGLYADVPGQSRIRFQARSSEAFEIRELNATVEFQRRWWQSHAPSLVLHRAGQPDVVGRRID